MQSFSQQLFHEHFWVPSIREVLGQGITAGRPGLCLRDVDCKREGISVAITGSKTDQGQKGTSLHIRKVVKSPVVCPVLAVQGYLQVCPYGKEALLIRFNGMPLTRYQFQAVLKKVAARLGLEISQYSSHSFRIGAATTAAMNGLSLEAMQHKGRWQLAAVKTCVPHEQTVESLTEQH